MEVIVRILLFLVHLIVAAWLVNTGGHLASQATDMFLVIMMIVGIYILFVTIIIHTQQLITFFKKQIQNP